MNYTRGSVWRKWDLHIHTPASYDWKGGKKLVDMTAKEADMFFSDMKRTIEESDVSVFAVVDHWTLDGYIAFRQYLKESGVALKKLFLPGIEIRVEAPVDYKLNVQIVFSDELSDQQLKDFLSKLKITFASGNQNGGRALSDDCLIEYARQFDKDKARKHGYADPVSLTNPDLLILGKMTAKITRESLSEAMKELPTDTAYIIQPYDTSDGLVDLDWEDHPHDDNYLMRTAHMFETRREDSVDLFLGVKTEANERFLENFQKTLGGKPKPAICGSDAHRLVDYGKYPGDKATWVKADPTFEGLKQILYEPLLRTRIQPESPDVKKPYFIVDRIRFMDNSDTTFPGSYIPVNQDLTTIIGGKSTGKSMLLYYVAKTIDPHEVQERLSIEGSGELPYDFEESPHFDFEVVWSDGISQTIKKPDTEDSDRKILYIPQNYLNKLSEKDLHSKLTLNEFVLNVLLQDSEANNSYTASQKQISLLKKNIQNELTDLFQLLEDGKELSESIRQKGDSKGIQKYIDTLKAEIMGVKKQSGLTVQEMKTYEDKVEKIENATEEISHLEDDRENIISLHESLLEQNETFDDIYREYDEVINTESLKLSIKKELAFIDKIALSINQSRDKLTKQIDKHIKLTRTEAKRLEIELKPLVSKVKLRSSLTTKNQALVAEQAKLSIILLDQKKLAAKRKAYTEKLEAIFKYYSEIYGCYVELTNNFALYDDHFEDITLNVVTEFKVELFNRNVVGEYMNKNDIKRVDEDSSSSSEYLYVFDPGSHLEKFKNIYMELIRGKIKTVKGRSIQDAVTHLLEDLFFLDFKISYKGDPLHKMSPGKKGLVLLRLLIDLSDEEWPILLDQPEDDLDNRSIYNELAIYLSRKKQDRQIIIVTHNPNLVVTTDSDEVIVANQDNQEAGRDNRKYRFEYVSGALENTFKKDLSEEPSILYNKGIREHTCEILEGGEEAFSKREEKYNLKNKK